MKDIKNSFENFGINGEEGLEAFIDANLSKSPLNADESFADAAILRILEDDVNLENIDAKTDALFRVQAARGGKNFTEDTLKKIFAGNNSAWNIFAKIGSFSAAAVAAFALYVSIEPASIENDNADYYAAIKILEADMTAMVALLEVEEFFDL